VHGVSRLSIALLGSLASAPAPACTLPVEAGTALGEGDVRLVWRSTPAPPLVGQPFVLRVAACPGLTLARVDAAMPEHRHGMNYRPTLHAEGECRWRAEGLLWHMAGRWELRFVVVDAAGTRHRLRESVVLR
jgi:hypothetical protein